LISAPHFRETKRAGLSCLRCQNDIVNRFCSFEPARHEAKSGENLVRNMKSTPKRRDDLRMPIRRAGRELKVPLDSSPESPRLLSMGLHHERGELFSTFVRTQRSKCVTCRHVINFYDYSTDVYTIALHFPLISSPHPASNVRRALCAQPIAFHVHENQTCRPSRTFSCRPEVRANVYLKIIGNINHPDREESIKLTVVSRAWSWYEEGRVKSSAFRSSRLKLMSPASFFIPPRTAVFEIDYKWIIILIDHVIYFICSCT
jgi:hypothetical protein